MTSRRGLELSATFPDAVCATAPVTNNKNIPTHKTTYFCIESPTRYWVSYKGARFEITFLDILSVSNDYAIPIFAVHCANRCIQDSAARAVSGFFLWI